MNSNSESNNFNKIYSNLKITKEQIYENINEIKTIRDDFEKMFLINTAQFFTDKLITLEQTQPNSNRKNDAGRDEIYKMAKYLHEKEQYHRAANLLISKNLHLNDLSARYLTSKCYYDCKEYSKSLEILNLPMDDVTFDENGGSFNQWKSSIELLKGYIYAAMNDKITANKFFMDALSLDPFCYEAFQELIKFDMITKEQESQLLDNLESKSSEDEFDAINVLKQLYKLQFSGMKDIENQLNGKKEETSQNESSKSSVMESISSSNDLRLIQAENYYNQCQFEESYEILSKIQSMDTLNPKCLFLMINCLLELENKIGIVLFAIVTHNNVSITALQKMAHKLVEAIPESPISWYSVGCYYYLTSNMDNARKYFSKSVLIDPTFQASMLMYGHSFEMEALHDQAIATYLDLSRVMTHSFLPLLYVGVEYCHLNNPTMAEEYLIQALELSSNDIFVLHELGIVYYRKKDFENAKKYFTKVYNILAAKKFMMKFPKKWEPLMNNLGHVHRKLGNYDDAIFYYQLALRMLPNNSSTLDALGLVYSLKGELQMSCDYFQKALSLKRDDAFALTMYNLVFQQI